MTAAVRSGRAGQPGMRRHREDLENFFEQLLEAGFLDNNTPEIQRFSVTLHRLLAAGKPVRRDDLATAMAMTTDKVAALLSTIPPSAIDFDEDGAVSAFIGLSLAPTRHEFRVDGLTLYTWCAFDALFLPRILARPAHILTVCPATNNAVEVQMTARRLVAVDPPDAVMSIVAPDRKSYAGDLRGTFCCHVNFFTDAAAFKEWAQGRDDVACVDIAEAARLATLRNAARLGDIDL